MWDLKVFVMDNYFLINRKLFDNEIWFSEPFTRAQAWIDLIGGASFKDTYFFVRGNEVRIKRGEVGWSELTMAKRWKWSRNKVRLFLKWLEKEQQIQQRKLFRITTIVRVLNYDKYQKRTTDDTTEGQQKDNRRYTSKECIKKDKRIIKEILSKDSTRHGREDINECIFFFEEQLGSPLDESQQMNRRYCKLLLDKLTKAYPQSNAVKNVRALIVAGLADEWHGKHLTSFKYLYYNAGKIILSRKKDQLKIINLDAPK